MTLLCVRTYVVLLFIGGAVGCLLNDRCKAYENDANIAKSSSNMVQYCELWSKMLACYSVDVSDCPTPGTALDAHKATYYSACSLTASDVTSCIITTSSCLAGDALLNAIGKLQTGDLNGYCSGIQAVIGCIQDTRSGCSQQVKAYDILGPVYASYDQMCLSTSAKTIACQLKLVHAGCSAKLEEIGTAFAASNITAMCSLTDSYLKCAETVLATCDPSVNKSSILGLTEQNNQLCGGTPLEKCTRKSYECLEYLLTAINNTSNPEIFCSSIKDYLGCIERKVLPKCDPSLTLSQVIGPMETSFSFICTMGGKGYCPAAMSCMMSLLQDNPTTTPSTVLGQMNNKLDLVPTSPDIMKSCSRVGDVMDCLDMEMGKCDLRSSRPYTFKEVSKLYTDTCAHLVSNGDLVTCGEMNTCMNSLNVPSDPKELSKLFYDPQFWCSFLKTSLTCADSSNDCQAEGNVISSSLKEVNELCSEAPLLMTVTAISSSHTKAGFLSLMSVLLAVLWIRH